MVAEDPAFVSALTQATSSSPLVTANEAVTTVPEPAVSMALVWPGDTAMANLIHP